MFSAGCRRFLQPFGLLPAGAAAAVAGARGGGGNAFQGGLQAAGGEAAHPDATGVAGERRTSGTPFLSTGNLVRLFGFDTVLAIS